MISAIIPVHNGERVTGEDGFFVFQCAMKQPRVTLTDAAVYRYHRNPEGATRRGFTEKNGKIPCIFWRKRESC